MRYKIVFLILNDGKALLTVGKKKQHKPSLRLRRQRGNISKTKKMASSKTLETIF